MDDREKHDPVRKVIVVNGKPRVGKDTTIEIMTRMLNAQNVSVSSFSSIQPVIYMLLRAGIDVSLKTPEDRALLAEIGASLEKYKQWRSKMAFEYVARHFMMHSPGTSDAVVFLHVREPEVMERLENQFVENGWTFDTILVRSKRAVNITNNAADMNVHDVEYDFEITNDGSLEDLEIACANMLRLMGLLR